MAKQPKAPLWTPETERHNVHSVSLQNYPYRHYVAHCEDGLEVAFRDTPSTVIGATEDKPGLTWWAAGIAADYLLDHHMNIVLSHNVAVNSDDPEQIRKWRESWYTGARSQHNKVKEEAGKIGTVVHFIINRYLKTGEGPTELDQQESLAFYQFVRWWEQAGMQVIETEVPLVSFQLGYAGTIDLVAMDQMGNYVIIDFKTSRELRRGYIMQLAAYQLLWNENHHYAVSRVDDAFLIHIPKDGSEFRTLHFNEELWDASQGFMDALTLSRYQQQADALLKEKLK